MRERNPINFDFRVVALMTVMITRPDILSDYLAGKPNTPLVLFPDDLLKKAQFLLKQPGVLDGFGTVQRFYATLEAYDEYCETGCPDDDWFAPYVAATAQIHQQLNPAGVEVEA